VNKEIKRKIITPLENKSNKRKITSPYEIKFKYLKYFVKDLQFATKIGCEETVKCLLRYLSKNPKFFLALKEILNKIFNSEIIIDNEIKEKLRKYKKILYRIAQDKCANDRKKLVAQSSGFLHLLFPIIEPLIPNEDSICSGKIKQKKFRLLNDITPDQDYDRTTDEENDYEEQDSESE
jgi:hypothetical protein